MMNRGLLSALFAAGALAGSCHRQDQPAPYNPIPVMATHTWDSISPTSALANLHNVAQQSPEAIALLPGVPVPQGLLNIIPSILANPGAGYLSSIISPPEGCTSLSGTIPVYGTGAATSTAAAASGTGYSSGAASSGAATTGSSGSSAASTAAASSGSASSGASSGAASTSGATSGATSGTAATTGTSTGTTAATTATTTSGASTSTSATTSASSGISIPTECAVPRQRVEWRNMSGGQQTQLVQAIQCLMKAPARSGLAGTKSRWDDLTAVHQQMSPIVHNVGQFLPWHRYFMWIYEQELRNTCSYTGPIPWWDETKDAGHFNSAPMFTSSYYGSMPDGSNQCITNGEFARLMIPIGPGMTDQNHCLSRGCTESLSAGITQQFVNTCNSYANYEDMNNCQFFGPHAYGHDAVGGVMSDVASSPSDPTFFLHHGFVDRNWRAWQAVQPSNRTYAIGGFTTQNCGSSCAPTTLNYQLSSKGFYPAVTVAQVMDTQGALTCYTYDY